MGSGRKDPPEIGPYDGPAGGWGSLESVTRFLLHEERPLEGARLLARQNKPDGFACVSCAWAKPARPHPAEFCENGAKATAWEITRKTVDEEFFAAHPLSELETWADHDLEAAGRLVRPLRWEAASDRYVPVRWGDALAHIAEELRALRPEEVVFYCSGRAALETSYLWQLFARLYGSNHLPDSSNMCHESSSVALPQSIGSPVGTVQLEDFEHTDCIFHIGQNVATSSPRMLHPLQEAVKRGVTIVTFNPLRERGLERFVNPQEPLEMLTARETAISAQYHQVKVGGDIAALSGVCKAVIEADDRARANGAPRVLDARFIADHTHGFEAFAQAMRAYDWRELERVSGLERASMEAAAAVYARARNAIAVYGMGLTQHVRGVDNVHMVTNLLLLRGNIGRRGAGVCAVRGHSNVQGQRTVGITEKPELAPLDRLKELYGFEPPRWKGHTSVEACEAMARGEAKAFLALGGNFVRAAPDTRAVEAAWRRQRLTVGIATKLNRSHVIHGEIAYLLPCLGRIEIDRQASGPQAVSVESSVAHFHGSRGYATPVSPALLSEPRIVAELAKATLCPNPRVRWDEWANDYARIRDAIEATWPDVFANYNARLFEPGGFARPVPARERRWKTSTGRANFIVPGALFAGRAGTAEHDVLQLSTLRSNDQFNTTVYGYRDRFRGVEGTRHVVFMNANDVARFGLRDGDLVDLVTAVDDGVDRRVRGLRVVAYAIPSGCCGAYFPEANPLIPLAHRAEESNVPAYKATPVRVVRHA